MLLWRWRNVAVAWQLLAPLFSALLNYRYSPVEQEPAMAGQSQDWQGIQLLSMEERTNYPVCLSIDDQGQDFVLTAQVVDSIAAQRLCDYMHTALEHLSQALTQKPHNRANEIDILPAAERQQLLHDWNDTQVEYGQAETIAGLFEAQVERSPHQIAVICGDQHLSYQQLNAKANQLAHYLRSAGVGPDVLVGLCVERSPEMIIGLLGILKGRWRLCAAGPGLSRRPAGLYAGRCTARGIADPAAGSGAITIQQPGHPALLP